MAANSGSSGMLEDNAHVFPVRVYYEDTDAGGIVYYANYLKFAERARTELLRLSGINQSVLISEQGVAFAVRQCSADFLKPARLDDALEVHTRVLQIRGASVEMAQSIKRDGVDMVKVGVKLACMSGFDRPSRIPVPVRAVLLNFVNRKMASLDGT